MKWLDCSKIEMVLVGFAAVIVIASGSANADFIFGTPTNLGPVVNSSAYDAYEHPGGMTADGLALYFSSKRPGGTSKWYDIWVTTRPTIDDPWEEPVNLGPTINTSMSEIEPELSNDGLTLFFSCRWENEFPNFDVWMTTRPTTNDPWGSPVNLGPTVNSSYRDGAPSITADGLTLFIDSLRPGGSGGWDVWMTTRPTIHDDWGTPVNLGPTVNSSADDGCPEISADGLMLFFSSKRPGGYGDSDIWVTTRATTSEPWSTPVNLGPPINSSARENRPRLSADGQLLLFESVRPAGMADSDIWQAPIIPIVDFNGDGIVDSADMCIMVDHWAENYPLCDIGPTPLGDGIVDVQDLIVLAEHLFEDDRLLAHWKLDETEGIRAADSAGGNGAYVIGGAVWQPTSGKMNGALQFDGVDDYVITPFVLNPADGAFSVFAWMKGGAPGQVIISQAAGANWLCTDSSGGNLMTELRFIGDGVGEPPLLSQTLITDGNWHEVGFVSDASDRILYVDDVEVARDTQGGLGSSESGLYIGAGKNVDADSFFSGLIDDVRIYDRAITP